MSKAFGHDSTTDEVLEGVGLTGKRVLVTGRPLYAGPREVWRRWGDREGGKREIVVQDPDGYLVMLAEDLGERPLSANARA